MAYTTINDPSIHFNTVLYTGNGKDDRAVIGTGFQPDWLWYKERSSTSEHRAFDSSRGASKRLEPNNTNTEATDTTNHKSFDSDGFTVGTSGSTNAVGDTYVAWQWKANGGTTTTNDASATGVGTIDSVFQANTTAGFSIVTHTGTGSAGTIAHGLGAVPKWMLIKRRTGTTENWCNYHASNTSAPATDVFFLNSADATADTDSVWNDTDPTSTVFSVKDGGAVNESGGTYVTYLFTPIQGYSKFGGYTGNGNADGTFVYTGFKPAWLMIKRINSSNNWHIHDNKRDTFNVANSPLLANTSDAELTNTTVDFLSNGFKLRTSVNFANGSEAYVYFAFAESPFVTSNKVPNNAR